MTPPTRLATFAFCAACSTSTSGLARLSDAAPEVAAADAADSSIEFADVRARTDLSPDRPLPPREGDPCTSVVDLNARGVMRGGVLTFLADGASAPERTLGGVPVCTGERPTLSFVTAFRYTAGATAALSITVTDRSLGQPLELSVVLASACAPDARAWKCLSGPMPLGFYALQTETHIPAGTALYLFVGTRLPLPAQIDPAGRFEVTVRELPMHPPGGSCGYWQATCVDGAACNAFDDGTCVPGGDVDGACLPDRPCAEGLVCDHGACVRALAVGDRCNASELVTHCPAGTLCITHEMDDRCAPYGAWGTPCGEVAPRCEAGLSCVGGWCARAQGEGESCSHLRACDDALFCVIPDGAVEGACVRRGASRTPCRTQSPRCDAGLACAIEIESSPVCLPAVALGAACDVARRLSACEAGVCFDNRCRPDGADGGRCRASSTPCDPGLGCVGPPYLCRPFVSGTSNCDRGACPPGSVCTRPSGAAAERCVNDGANGGRCRRDGPACDAGLACGHIASSSVPRCRPAVPLGGRCDLHGTQFACADGSICATDEVCRRPGALGSLCADTEPGCDDGLQCVWRRADFPGVCERTLARGAACVPFSTLCPAGQTCLDGRVSRCTDDGTQVHTACRAGASPCDAGMICHPRTLHCVRLAEVGGTCDPYESNTLCAAGASCISVGESSPRCVRDGVVGGRCRATGTPCDAGLRCTDLPRMLLARCV